MELEDVLILHQAGQLVAAEQAYLQWLEEHPEQQSIFHFVWNKLGSLYFTQQKWREAAAAYQHAIDLRPDYQDAYYNLGLVLSKSHDIEHALVTWRALLELAPDHAGAHFQVGCLMMQKGQFNEALQQFAAIKEDNASYVEARANMATCCLQLGWLKQAKQHYLHVLDIAQEDAQTLYNLGVVCAQQGDLEEAISYYLRAIAIDPNIFAAHNNLGAVYLTLKQRELAEKHFQEALRIQPGNEAIRHTLAILAQKNDITTSPSAYISTLFDAYADHYDAHLSQSLHYQVPALMYEMVHHAVQLPKHQWRVLDLGCGTGLCGQYFREAACELTGVDLSTKMLDVARSKQLYDKLVHAEVLSFMQQQNQTYDLILAADMLVYQGDLAPVFAAVYHALRPSGYFIFNVEAADKDDFHLTSSGRFAHSKAYLDQLITNNQFNALAFRMMTLRTQEGKPVPGYLYMLQR